MNSVCHNGGEWNGDIDTPLRKLLGRVGEFFQWVDEHRPRMREEVHNLIRAISAPREALPRRAQEQAVTEWMELYRYFVGCAHHGRRPSLDDFVGRFEWLERTLLDLLAPLSSEELAEMDDIIQRYET